MVIELRHLDREVDVWALDNAAHTSVLPGDQGDRLIHLARVAPGEGDAVRIQRSLGEMAFRGFQLDWIFVSVAGSDPSESRLGISTRTYFERLYTRQRLERDGFDVSIPPRPRPVDQEALDMKNISATARPLIATRPDKILVQLGLVTQQQFDGADVFFRETFDGNGRSCGTCHPAENNQTIDGPDFLANLPDSDPLFVAEQRPPYDPISQLEVPKLMREFGLIVENVDGGENPTVKFLLRGVPHSLSLATSTNPDDGVRTGWSGDGAPAPGTIRMFLLGATIQHYPNVTLDRIPGIDFRLPTDEELDDNVEFMLSVGRLNDINLAGVSLNNANAESGRVSFIGSPCNACHSNASANVASGVNLNFNTGVELLPNPAAVADPTPLDAPEYPGDGGFGTANAPNFDCDGDGVLDCFGNGTFNTTPLIEAADTEPFFHNNTAATIEDATRFYTAPPFPNPINFDEPTVRNVAAFMRVMNASFNLQQAAQRNAGALELNKYMASSGLSKRVFATANKLLSLSNDENDDALRVLTGGPLGNLDYTATALIQQAIAWNKEAMSTTSLEKRKELITAARQNLQAADASLGSGTAFTMGAGNLLF